VQEGWRLLKKARLTRQATALGPETEKGSMQEVEHTKTRTHSGGGVQKHSLVA